MASNLKRDIKEKVKERDKYIKWVIIKRTTTKSYIKYNV